MTKRVNNCDVVRVALRTGEDTQNATGSFRFEYGTPHAITRGYGYHLITWHHARMIETFNRRRENITAVIWSYQTPIAWRDGDEWITPDARYSATTGSKHLPYVNIPNRVTIPHDTGHDYESFLSRKSIYTGKTVIAA